LPPNTLPDHCTPTVAAVPAIPFGAFLLCESWDPQCSHGTIDMVIMWFFVTQTMFRFPHFLHAPTILTIGSPRHPSPGQ
jgi:hypothetical protein